MSSRREAAKVFHGYEGVNQLLSVRVGEGHPGARQAEQRTFCFSSKPVKIIHF
jgi:hypothetical protein